MIWWQPRPMLAQGRSRGPLVIGALTVLAHLLTANDSYGIFRDELYYLANAEHLALGYVDHPPGIAWFAWLSRNLLGDSMVALRCASALVGGATVVTAGLCAAALGGRRYAQVLASLAVALAPVFVALFGFLSMNPFDTLIWATLSYLLIRTLDDAPPQRWLLIGALFGLGLWFKLSPGLLALGLLSGLALTPARSHLRSRWPWLGALLAAAIIAPHLLWQITAGWPVLEFTANAANAKNLALAPSAFLASAAQQQNYLAAPMAIAGFVYLARGRWRTLAWACATVLAILLWTSAKPYYLSPLYPLLFAAGAVQLERWTAAPPRRWIRGLYLALLVISAAIMAPLAKPLLPIERFVAYQSLLGLSPSTSERKAVGRLPQNFADRLGWPELAESVAAAHRTLTPTEQLQACVFAQNYGQAGALDLYGPRLGLPPVISGHNSYYDWGPGACDGSVMIIIGDDRETLEGLFTSVELAARQACVDCMPYESDKPIWIGRGLKIPMAELWRRVKNYS